MDLIFRDQKHDHHYLHNHDDEDKDDDDDDDEKNRLLYCLTLYKTVIIGSQLIRSTNSSDTYTHLFYYIIALVTMIITSTSKRNNKV